MTGKKLMEKKSNAHRVVEVIKNEVLLTKTVSGQCRCPWQVGFIKAGRLMKV